MELLFATKNPAKVKSYAERLKEHGIELISIKDLDFELNIEENGKNSLENAYIKAEVYYEKTKIPTLGMDVSLILEELPEDKQIGTHIRRINGKYLTDKESIEYYTNLTKEYGGKLTAKWVYGLSLIVNGEEKTFTWSKEDFYIVSTPSIKINPGYPLNTISINKKLNKYFTDITKEDKELIKEDEHEVVEFIVSNI